MEEFWDDSALIKAYDKAVNSFKVCLCIYIYCIYILCSSQMSLAPYPCTQSWGKLVNQVISKTNNS